MPSRSTIFVGYSQYICIATTSGIFTDNITDRMLSNKSLTTITNGIRSKSVLKAY
jgi:hypothetical protein